ncbi:MAG: class I SAM-dependent methyltransferase [Myxococcota bacterium]
MLKPIGARLLDPKEQVLPKGTVSGKALEVGCGSGRLLAQLAAAGWEVVGLEPSQATVDRIRRQTNLEIFHGAIDSAEFSDDSFDLVAAIMVLEHLHDPLGDLKKMRRWLRPGAHLMGSVPNCASWEFRYFGPEWYALQVPTHLFHYTPDTLSAMLQQAGFYRIAVYHQRNVNNLMVHLGRWLAQRKSRFARVCLEYPEKGSVGLRLALRPIASLLAWLRQAGRITFVAENPVDTH